MLNVIDISSWQADLDVSRMTTTQAVIVKATEGTGYTNPSFTKHMQQAKKAGKLRGVYHFATKGNANDQANFFYQTVKDYLDGSCIAVLDWEGAAVKQGPEWAEQFLKTFHRLSGVRPLIYMSQSVCSSFKEIPNDAGLWVAYYPPVKHPNFAYKADFGKSIEPWDFMAMWQYCSDGRVTGYGANLDLSHFYGDKAAWLAYASKAKNEPAKKVQTYDLNQGNVKVHIEIS